MLEDHHSGLGLKLLLMHKSPFRTGSEIAPCALKSAKILQNWCESESNGIFLATFSAELVNDLEGALGATSA